MPNEPSIVEHFRGREGLSRLFYFKARLNDMRMPQEFFKQHHQLFYWQLPLHQPRDFNGVINRISHLGQNLDGSHKYELWLVPTVWQLTQQICSRTFINLTVPQLVAQLLTANNVVDFRFLLTRKNYATRDFVAQYFVSTWQFIERLLFEEGIFYYFTFKGDKHILHFADSVNAYQQSSEPIYFKGETQHQNYISDWQEQHALAAEQIILQDYDYHQPDTIQQQTAAVANAGKTELYPTRLAYHFAVNGQAQARADACAQQINYVKGRSYYVNFCPGLRVKSHVLQTVFHFYQHGQYYQNQFRAIDAARCFVAPPIPKPQTTGLDWATVVGTTQPVTTDQLARVQLNFSWQSDVTPTKPVRVAQWLADKGWGTQFMPHVGDTVLVAYEYDDPERPVVVASRFVDAALPTGITTLKQHIHWLEQATPIFDWYTAGDMRFSAQQFTNTVMTDQTIHLEQGDYSVTVSDGNYIYEAAKVLEMRVGQSVLRLEPNSILLASDIIALN